MPVFVLTHYAEETTALFRNDNNGFFSDNRWAAKVAVSGLGLVGWGTAFLDFDNDGNDDLFITDGHLVDNIQLLRDTASYAQKNQLFINKSGTFGQVLYSPESIVGRGVAYGDFDNDGNADILVTNNNQQSILYRNTWAGRNHWITIQLVGTKSNRDGIGSKVIIVTGGKTRIKQSNGGGSYLSASDHRLHFGLVNSSIIDQLVVHWPSGTTDQFRDVPGDQFIRIEEHGGMTRLESAMM